MLKYEIYWHLKAFASSHVKCCLNQRKAYTYLGLQAGTVFGCFHWAVLDINRPCTCMGYISGWKVLSLYFLSLSQPNCSLHLSQKFGQYYPYTRYSPMKSWTAAPGIIMATGTVKRENMNPMNTAATAREIVLKNLSSPENACRL